MAHIACVEQVFFFSIFLSKEINVKVFDALASQKNALKRDSSESELPRKGCMGSSLIYFGVLSCLSKTNLRFPWFPN